MFASELVLAFTWLINQSFRWRVVSRSAFPERLPNDDEQLPAIDMFICTVDPEKEPTTEVMNTVISAMCLDYPVEKLSVYLSDDGGSPLTLYTAQEAYEFARSWNPFCRKYKIETRSPDAYFCSCSTAVDGTDFVQEQRRMKNLLSLAFTFAIKYLIPRMCYAALAFQPINAFPELCYSLIPQLCLINAISLFPSVSTKRFLIFGAVHLSWMCQNLREEFVIGGTIKTWWKEERMRKMRCITSDLLTCFDFTMNCIGAKQIKFLLTNKAVNEKKLQLYENGIFDFEGSTMVLIPASTIAILSTITFLGGLVKVIMQESYGAMFGQLYISFFSMMSGYPILEGILIRKDKGKVPLAITLYSAVWAMFILIIFHRW
ncbi:Cellulose synthase-like protein E2 [Acorus calamus]|uniref:Cellulose synthase-like protein E2 n=1 Tax=Acorus calamus TaxID=4465 RepID=A0AAV9EYP9_ACOCL|nr:Cellulose synthase-like protein E2 [Acorus calamus]